MARSVVARCVKTAAAAGARRSAIGGGFSARRALAAAPVRMHQQQQQRALCSSSRFLSLADDGEDGKRKRRSDGGAEEEEEGAEEQGGEEEEGADASSSAADGEQDGDLELEEEEMYSFCVPDTDELDAELMALFMSDPAKWTPLRLARKFHLSKQRVEATLLLQAEEAGFTPASFRAKVDEITASVAAAHEAQAAKLASAETRGDEKEVKRLQKRDRQDQREAQEADDEQLTEEEELALLGIDDDFYRNPDFFFLSDEFDGLPPLTRRTGKHKSTDKMFPEEAAELQRLAANHQLAELPSFAKPTDVKGRWKIAVKDTSKNKLPLVIRDQDKTLRMATKDEVLPRTWVRRPPFFAGLGTSASN